MSGHRGDAHWASRLAFVTRGLLPADAGVLHAHHYVSPSFWTQPPEVGPVQPCGTVCPSAPERAQRSTLMPPWTERPPHRSGLFQNTSCRHLPPTPASPTWPVFNARFPRPSVRTVAGRERLAGRARRRHSAAGPSLRRSSRGSGAASSAKSLGLPLTGTHFQRVIPEDGPAAQNPGNVKRLLFCTGKVYYDLTRERKARDMVEQVAITRIEQVRAASGSGRPGPESAGAPAAPSLPADSSPSLSTAVPVPLRPPAAGGAEVPRGRAGLVPGGAQEPGLLRLREAPAADHHKPRQARVVGRGQGWGPGPGRAVAFALTTPSPPLRYAGRDPAAAPATGNKKTHLTELQRLLDTAFDLDAFKKFS